MFREVELDSFFLELDAPEGKLPFREHEPVFREVELDSFRVELEFREGELALLEHEPVFREVELDSLFLELELREGKLAFREHELVFREVELASLFLELHEERLELDARTIVRVEEVRALEGEGPERRLEVRAGAQETRAGSWCVVERECSISERDSPVPMPNDVHSVLVIEDAAGSTRHGWGA